jgi:hypothetical protein
VFVLAHPREKPSPEPHRTLPTFDTRVTTLYPVRNHIVAQSDELTLIESHSCTKPRGEGVPPRSNVLPAFPRLHDRPLFSTTSTPLFPQLLFTPSALCEGSFQIHTNRPRGWGEGMLPNFQPRASFPNRRPSISSSLQPRASSLQYPKSFRFHSYKKTPVTPLESTLTKSWDLKSPVFILLQKRVGGGGEC